MTADVLSFLRRSVAIAPGRAAVVGPDGALTYRQLAARVHEIARALPPRIGAPEPVAVVAEHDAAVPELYLGVMAAGHAVVPISSRLPEEAIARIARRAGIRVGLLAGSAQDRAASIRATADATAWVGGGELVTPPDRPATELPTGTAMVCFTSGTTGQPKGVLLTHTNLVVHGLAASGIFKVGATNCHVNPMPLAHLTGASRVVLATVQAGTHVILPSFEPDTCLDALVRWGGTHVAMVPTMAADLLAAEPERYDLGALETLVYGASPMPMVLARELQDRLGCGLVNGYGLTESAAVATALDADLHRRAVIDEDDALLGSVGLPIPGVEVAIMGKGNEPVEPGTPGQVALRGAKISVGYFDDPETTARHFLPDGWLLTGDEGRLDERGLLTLLGRIDDMIISGGLNVQPAEIEAETLDLPGVAACAAFGIPSERWGSELRLAVVLDPGAEVDPEDVRAHLRRRLDRYKVPKAVHVVDTLPRTSVGKIQRFALAEAGAAGTLTPAGAEPRTGDESDA